MYNNIVLVGNLGKDPKLSASSKGLEITKFSMATTNYYNNDKETQWHSVVCFGKTAVFVDTYCEKGSLVLVNGTLKYSTYEKDIGLRHKETVKQVTVIANNVSLIKKNPKDGNNEVNEKTDQDLSYNVEEGVSDDIPF